MRTNDRPDTEKSEHGWRLDQNLRLKPEEVAPLCDLIHKRFGIDLPVQKAYLIVSRLHKVLAARGFTSFGQYYEFLLQDNTGVALAELANRISTNHTFFNRESAHFEFFSQMVLPEISARHRNAGEHDLRIWSAGCSSGEEPYTLVMLMLEYFKREYLQWDAGVLATDISRKVLEKAVAGEYTGAELKHLPQHLRRIYFEKKADDLWVLAERVKREVTFRRLNLIRQQFPFRHSFDVIFCRNVMIYFDKDTRTELTRKFYNCLVPGGYLFIGHSETIPNDQFSLQYVRPATYRRPED